MLWALRSSNAEAAVAALEQGASINLLNDGVVEGAKDGDMGRVSLALRLGGRRVDAPGVDPDDVVIRHDLRGLE